MKEIKRYAIKIYGGPEGSGRGKRASIFLFDHTNLSLGNIDFWDQSVVAAPRDRLSEEYGIQLNLPVERLENVVDMLRHEEPVYLAWQERLKLAYLATSQEPIGEGE